jgi:hypothetical protein
MILCSPSPGIDASDTITYKRKASINHTKFTSEERRKEEKEKRGVVDELGVLVRSHAGTHTFDTSTFKGKGVNRA